MKFMPLYKEPIWWAWLATVALIAVGLAGYEAGFYAAIGLSVLQIVWLATVERSLWTLPVQVRIAYTVCLLAYEVSAMRGFYWFTAVGTVGNVHQGMPRVSGPCLGEATIGGVVGHR